MKGLYAYTLVAAAALLALSLSLAAPLTTVEAQRFPVTVAADLSHGQADEGLEVIMESCGVCYWIVILADEAQRENVRTEVLEAADEVRIGGLVYDNIADVSVILIGQPATLLSAEEVESIARWAQEGRKAIWVAGDSDYPAPGSEVAQQAVNQVLEAIGSSIRIDFVSVEDYQSNAQRSYRVVGLIMPDEPFTFLAEGLPNGGKVLFHGPGALYVLSEDGTPFNPVKNPELKPSNVYVIARTTENSKSVEHQTFDTGGFSAVLYDPLNDEVNTGPFPLMMAETLDNVLVFASSETMYGGYEPMTAPEYYGVALDGPEFVARVLQTMVAYTAGTFLVVQVTVVETVTETQEKTVTQTTTETVMETVTEVETVTETVTEEAIPAQELAIAAAIILVALVAAAFILRR